MNLSKIMLNKQKVAFVIKKIIDIFFIFIYMFCIYRFIYFYLYLLKLFKKSTLSIIWYPEIIIVFLIISLLFTILYCYIKGGWFYVLKKTIIRWLITIEIIIAILCSFNLLYFVASNQAIFSLFCNISSIASNNLNENNISNNIFSVNSNELETIEILNNTNNYNKDNYQTNIDEIAEADLFAEDDIDKNKFLNVIDDINKNIVIANIKTDKKNIVCNYTSNNLYALTTTSNNCDDKKSEIKVFSESESLLLIGHTLKWHSKFIIYGGFLGIISLILFFIGLGYIHKTIRTKLNSLFKIK